MDERHVTVSINIADTEEHRDIANCTMGLVTNSRAAVEKLLAGLLDLTWPITQGE